VSCVEALAISVILLGTTIITAMPSGAEISEGTSVYEGEGNVGVPGGSSFPEDEYLDMSDEYVPQSDIMDHEYPEPMGEAGSGWIADQSVDSGTNSVWNPSIASDSNGRLHAAWEHWSGLSVDILYAQSNDGGATWSTPVIVAGSSDAEWSPDIVVSPKVSGSGAGRIYIAYEHDYGAGKVDIIVEYSDNGISWTRVVVDPANTGMLLSPRIIIHHHYFIIDITYVFLTCVLYEGVNDYGLVFYRSLDKGQTYTKELCISCGIPGDVYVKPDLAYKSDSPEMLFLVYAYGTDTSLVTSVRLRWSDDGGATWFGAYVIATETPKVAFPTIAQSNDGDTLMVAWQRNVVGDYAIRYAYNQDPSIPDAGWSPIMTRSPTGTNGVDDYAPRLVADGEGTDNNVGGNFHLFWSVESPNEINYTTSNTSSPGTWSNAKRVTDTNPDSTYPLKGVTTQLRSGVWYPVLTWTNLGMTRYEIKCTTPGGVTVDTKPDNLDFIMGGVTYTAPHTFSDWATGILHTLQVSSPQLSGSPPDSRYTFFKWEDGSTETSRLATPQSVPPFDTETKYRAQFTTEYSVTLLTSPAKLQLEIGGSKFTTPASFWMPPMQYAVNAPSPQYIDSSTRYAYSSWDDGQGQSHSVLVDKPLTLTARFNAEYYWSVDTTRVTLPDGEGLQIVVDTSTYTAPWSTWWPYLSLHDIGTLAAQDVGDVRYTFQSWSDGGPLSHQIQVFGSESRFASFSPTAFKLIVTTSPIIGVTIDIDGAPSPSPVPVWWDSGSGHVIAAPSTWPSTADTRYAFSYWSDGGLQSHSTAVLEPRTITAYFDKEYLVTIDTSPSGKPILVDGRTVTGGQTFWWREDDIHHLEAPSYVDTGVGSRLSFLSWSNGLARTHDFVVLGPGTIIASYGGTEYQVTVDTSPGGLLFTVDSVDYTALESFWWTSGSGHAIEVLSPQTFHSFTWTFQSWSDGGARSHSVTINAPATYTATFVGSGGGIVTGDFALSAQPPMKVVAAGGSVAYTITVTEFGDYTGPAVGISLVAPPTGFSGSCSPSSVIPTSTCTLTVVVSSAVSQGNYVVAVQGSNGTASRNVEIAVQVTAVADFDISAFPATTTVEAGENTTLVALVTAINGYSGPAVSVSLRNPPSGFTGACSPGSVAPTASCVLTMDVAISVTAGSYDLTVQGSNGTLVKTTIVTITVTTPPSQGDFSIQSSVASIIVEVGESGSVTVNVLPLNGFSGLVVFYAGGLPANVGAAFSPTTISGSGSSTLTFAIAGNAVSGDYTIIINGTSGSTSHGVTVTLKISPSSDQPNVNRIEEIPTWAWGLILMLILVIVALLILLVRKNKKATKPTASEKANGQSSAQQSEEEELET